MLIKLNAHFDYHYLHAATLIYPEFKTKNHWKQETIYKKNDSKDSLSNLKNEPQNIDWWNVLKANQNNVEILWKANCKL